MFNYIINIIMNKDVIGIVAEFNPFHNGHLYFINEIKKKYPDSIIIVAMSGEFVQRGELSIYNKWERSKVAIENKVDLVIEIPPFFVLNNANIFAKKAIEILNEFGAKKIIFGSENLSIDEITNISKKIIKDNNSLEALKKKHHSLPKAFEEFVGKQIKPNDVLGICYILESQKMKLDISFENIKRIKSKEFTSASSIRKDLIKKNRSKKDLVKSKVKRSLNDYYEIIIGKILTSNTDNDVIKYVKNKLSNKSFNSFDSLIDEISNKSLTKSKLRREIMKFILELSKSDERIVLSFSKEGKNILKNIDNYSFGHKKNNDDNYKVELFLSIKSNNTLSELLSKKSV